MTGSSGADGTVLTIVPCLNEERNIARLLRTLLGDPANSLIVVADGGSTDTTRQIAVAMSRIDARIIVLDNPDRIQSAGINLAVAHFGEGRQWLARIDAHCRYPNDYVSRLLAAARLSGAASIVVPMVTLGERGFVLGVAAAQNSRLGTGGAAHRSGGRAGFVNHGHHALMDIAAFRTAGGYCEALPCNEDAELDLRLSACGSGIFLEPAALIGYYPRGSIGSLFRQYYRYGIGRATTTLRHKAPLRLRQAVPLAIAPACLALVAAPFAPVLAVPCIAWAALCQGWGAILAIKAGKPGVLYAGSAAMTMHLAWSLGFWVHLLSAGLLRRHRTDRPRLPFAA